MKLISLKINNFRAFLGEHEIDFAYSDEKNVTILLAENEVGKSSLLNSILWCFYGFLTEDTDRPEDLVHDDATTKLAEVEIRLSEKDKEYIFKRISRNGTESFKAYEIKPNGELGSPIQYPETLIDSFLPRELSSYFLFNGEGLKDIVQDSILLNRSVQDIQGLSAAREALEKIQQFNSNLGITLNKNKKASKEKAEYESEIEGLQADLEEKKRKLKAHEPILKKANQEQSDADKHWRNISIKSAAALDSQRTSVIKELNGQRTMLENAKKAKALHIRTFGIDILGFPFADDAAKLLKESNEKGYPSKFEKTMIEDSLEQCRCQLCDSPLPENSSNFKNIKEKLEMAIDDNLKDRVSKARSSLTAMKNIIQSYGDASENTDNQVAGIEKTIKEKDELLAKINKQIEELAKHQQEVKEAEERRKRAQKAVIDATTKQGLIENEISNIKVKLNEKRDKTPKISEDDSLTNEVAFLDDVCKTLDETIEEQEKSARDFIFNDMNDSLTKHSKGNHQFRFKKGTFEPVIVKNDGTPLKLSTGGKKLKRNLFFVTSLIKHSKKRANADGKLTIPGTVAPLIVDAPFTELDEDNQQIAGRVMLESTDQLILMVDSGSFNKGILEVLHENPEYKNRLGEVYCLIRHLQGKQDNKRMIKMDVFGNEIDSTIYGKKFDETKILRVDFD